MKYFVTYCAMDQRLANPFWHACFLLSSTPESGCKIEVKHAWGFYPVGMSNPDSLYTYFTYYLKKTLGFNFDLQGNFGILKKEEMRYLDLGYGLRGVTFEINEKQFEKLKQLCEEKIRDQESAIDEAKQNLLMDEGDPNSIQIFEEERRLALAQNRQPRLLPFDFRVSIGREGVSLNSSYTCKTMAVELLAAIGISQKYLDEITLQNTSTALPKYSGGLEEIFIHSTGPRREYKSGRTGNITLFRQWGDANNKLYWSLPPQLIAFAANDSDDLEYQNHEYVLSLKWSDAAKKFLSRLQQMEHVVIHAEVGEPYENQRQLLIKNICDLYEAFSLMNADSQTLDVRTNLYQANYFLNRMYSAINEAWNDGDIIEAVASKFDSESQLKICKILGRPYVNKMDDDLKCTLWC